MHVEIDGHNISLSPPLMSVHDMIFYDTEYASLKVRLIMLIMKKLSNILMLLIQKLYIIKE